MFGIKRLETQIADQAKTIAELSGGLLAARGEIAALYMMARILLAGIEELSGADREEIITVLKEAVGRGSGWNTPGASADDEQIFNDAYSRVLQAFIKDSEGPPPPESQEAQEPVGERDGPRVRPEPETHPAPPLSHEKAAKTEPSQKKTPPRKSPRKRGRR
jgi:hypothetical protein